MFSQATDGALLEELVALCISICQMPEQVCPRQGPGRKPVIPEWTLAVMIMVAIMLKKKTKSAQYCWWLQHPNDFARWFPGQPFPGRSTFFDRYRRVHRLYRQAIVLQGKEAVRRGWANAECVAADKSLIAGQGPRWNAAQRNKGKLPRGVDADTTWGFSEHDGWVQGYSFEVVVTASAQGVVWPLLASVDTASRSEQKTILDKIPELPKRTTYVLADAGYDSNAVGEKVEWDGDRRTGRRGRAQKFHDQTRVANASRTIEKRANVNDTGVYATAGVVIFTRVEDGPYTLAARPKSSRSMPNSNTYLNWNTKFGTEDWTTTAP